MSTTNEAKSDLEAVCRAIAEKRPIDPEVARRVHERAAQVPTRFDREVSVELIRELRDGDG